MANERPEASHVSRVSLPGPKGEPFIARVQGRPDHDLPEGTEFAGRPGRAAMH